MATHRFKYFPPRKTCAMSLARCGRLLPTCAHVRSDNCVRTIAKVPSVTRSPETKRGRIPPIVTPPPRATSQAASIGPATPRSPAATVSQSSIPVARSRLTKQFPQIVAQL